jgi:hypothetical protein
MFIENVTIILLFCLDNGIVRTAGIHIHRYPNYTHNIWIRSIDSLVFPDQGARYSALPFEDLIKKVKEMCSN